MSAEKRSRAARKGEALPRAKRGRPFKADAERRQDELLDHTLEQFMAVGYRAATMDGIAASFGASKSTIYRRYGSKAGLLRAAMERGVPLLLDPLTNVSTDARRSPRSVLRDYGEIIQSYHADPSIRAMWRAVSEAREELNEMLEDVVDQQDRALAPIAEYLTALALNGKIVVSDPRAAAACFGALTSGGLASFLGEPLRDKERHAALELALTLFLDGILPRAMDRK
ncbi:TetR/AcrR family transcriptional regulator [Paraburkholderia youngii]|uniref:TetR/AcrR family transcriptional regulator n=1 Tax=Paraburkholderia youngii TaxID=2782701 RepID=A0A7Y6K5R6_9BURK|nr:TetR/AcrR family transcriptional regulator [Paraburkholderia youngii]NUY04900.1 TetR/AcrR family transcriptional regulator [Paraburkholderia youngii]